MEYMNVIYNSVYAELHNGRKWIFVAIYSIIVSQHTAFWGYVQTWAKFPIFSSSRSFAIPL